MVTGFTHYKGFRAAQHLSFELVFSEFLSSNKFDVIVEIGTLNGGLTRFLKDVSPNSRLVSYDITNQPEHPDLVKYGVELKIKNIFDQNYNLVDQEAVDILGGTGKKLILCDGGNKVAEFNTLAKYMSIGDFIMAHDYSESVAYYEAHIKNKVWNWCEIVEDSISVASVENNLQHYDKEKFQGIVWVCKTKV